MRLPKFSKKLITIGAAAGIAMGAAGVAAAFLTGTGTGTGTAQVSGASNWTVSSVKVPGTLTPGGAALPVKFTVQNNTAGSLKLTKETVTIGTIIAATGKTCTATAQKAFKLVDEDGWDMYTNGVPDTPPPPDTHGFAGTTATQGGGIVVAGGYAGTTTGTQYLTIEELTLPTVNQDGCEGATVTLNVNVT